MFLYVPGADRELHCAIHKQKKACLLSRQAFFVITLKDYSTTKREVPLEHCKV